jgi:hypothetical protein
MMGRLNPDQEQLFYSFRLDEALPHDHLVRKIAAVLDLSWVHSDLRDYCDFTVLRDHQRLLQHGVIPGSSQTKARESALQEHMRPPTHPASQRWRATMECYVGLDVSLKQTSICVVSGTGSVVREGIVD